MPRQIKELEDEFQKGQFVDVSVITKQPMAPQLPVFVNISSARRARIIAVLDAGTSFNNDKIVTNGGRVLSIVSSGKSMNAALKKSYKNIDKIEFEGKVFRKDIGFDL